MPPTPSAHRASTISGPAWAFSLSLRGRWPAAAILLGRCIAEIGRSPNDAVHDCDIRCIAASGIKTTMQEGPRDSNDAAFYLIYREVVDGEMDSVRARWKDRFWHAGRR